MFLREEERKRQGGEGKRREEKVKEGWREGREKGRNGIKITGEMDG